MKMRLQRLLRTASLALLFAGSASAQTTGVVIGVVTDTSTGKPIVGALVVASSALQGEQTAVTDPAGNYRFDLLPPGQYKLVAQLDGYKPFERNDVNVKLGKTLKVPMSMVPEAVQLEEQVVRTGQVAPVINVGSAETGVTVGKEFIASVPVGRDFSDTALIAPSARADVYGLSFNGATSPENGYVVDGLNTTDPAFGRQGTAMLNNFVDQVDVKTSGFMPEYGRATGGVISMVTKSGSNEFHGSVWGNYTPGALSPTARAITSNATAVTGQIAIDKQYNTDFGFEVGGPIMKDKLWFYAGFAPRLNHVVTDRYYQYNTRDPTTGLAAVDATGLIIGTKVPGSDQFISGNDNQYQITGKLTYLLNENHTFSAMFYTAPGSLTNTVPLTIYGAPIVNGTTSSFLTNTTYGTTDAIGRWAGKFADRRLIVEAVGGWHHQNNEFDPKTVDGVNQGSTSAVQWGLPHSLTDFYDNLGGTPCEPSATFVPCPVTRFLTGGYGFYDRINLDRLSGRVSASGLFNAAGQHNVKGGIDLERSFYDHWKTYSGGILLRERNSSSLGPFFQDYRSYGVVTDTNVDPARIALSVTSVTDSRAYYLQDSWTPLERLTLNYGLRWETQDMFKQGSSVSNLAINDNIAPRVQVIYDFTGQGRSKVAAHWGRYYEAIPLDMGDRSFGGETQVQASRSHCVDASPTVGGTPALCPVIPNATFDAASGRLVTFAPYSNAVVPVAPDLKGQYTDQFGGNIEYEVVTDLSIGFEYRGTRLGRVIEDMSVNDGTDFFIANPGQSKPFSIVQSNGTTAVVDPKVATTIDPVTLRSIQVPFPKPIREYDGFTFDVRKTFSNHWQGGVSYTYSILKGNYAGLFRAENGQLDPNITSEYDLAALMNNRYGPLPNDTPHQFKLYGSYNFDIQPRWNATVGTQIRAISGTPISYLGSHPLYGPSEAFILPRGYGGRTPPVTSVDLQAQTQYTIRAPYTLTFSLAFFNILNSQTATSVDQNYTFDNVLPIQNGACHNKNGANASNPTQGALADCPDLQYLRTTDGRPVTVNPNFGRPTSYQLPLSIRFGLALAF